MEHTHVDKIYSDYIHASRYARYLPDKGRRETWDETVSRYAEFFEPLVASVQGSKLQKNYEAAIESIRSYEVMPSMRALMTAGPALERDNVAGYNCCYVPVDDRRVFDEIMYILMCGTGVGFSVERKYINKLPEVASEFHPANTTIHVPDSRIGWATSYRKLISLLYDGFVPEIDYSRIRPAGAVLKTFGGRSSGPEPLRSLFEYSISTFKGAAGRKLNELECHDLVCKIAEVIVCGGVRRSALISLSNLTSERMREAKTGQWWIADGHRALANNSVSYTEKPDISAFISEWEALIRSKSGERGIFNRQSCEKNLPERREGGHEWGTNPCSEIVLRPRQFCNLSEAVLRPEDTQDDRLRKVRHATILGTLQSCLTDFRYLGSRYKHNCEEERLLGVSLTGIQDCSKVTNAELEQLREEAIRTNEEWAEALDIPKSAAITCVKPSGTVSQLVNAASGIHPRYSRYYIRRVRSDFKDPITQHLIDQGVPHETDVTNPNQCVFSFPLRAPSSAKTVQDTSALAQLEDWRRYANHYCEHKPSVSIYVRDHEWLEVGAWVYKNFDLMSGVSFFPYDDHVYQQAPYEAIDKKTFDKMLKEFPTNVSVTGFSEDGDNTTASQELACTAASGCEI